jgi:prepilin-type processing-associated H-X9-DG protein
MNFGVGTIAYVFALLAAAMTVFQGPLGLLPAAGVLAAWSFWRRRGTAGVAVRLVVVVTMIGLPLLAIPAVYASREATRQSQCMSQLKELALSILNFESAKGRLPMAHWRSASGNSTHSWRMLVLPYLEVASPWTRYRFDEAWDSDHNRHHVTNVTGGRFGCPLSAREFGRQTTNYFAVVDEQTVWPPQQGGLISDIHDGMATTVLLIEIPDKHTPWAKPDDLTLDQALAYLTTKPIDINAGHALGEGYFYKRTPAVNLAFADGHVQRVRLPLSHETAKGLLTAHGFEPIDLGRLEQPVDRELDYAKCYALAAYVALALWPLRSARRKASQVAPSIELTAPAASAPAQRATT